ncbi:SHOCT domain-containing protein [Nocardia camponoti]|uniref:Membrane protein n=1 Tax=Nocardia camponoti TaxID=1616106 RepID=A0A917VA27_9NOCA|nr:SHOCT domain-containing protein [Nocardia camponoti]GGK53947.1 membrane protein [Nocardia camponoti]
MSFWDFVWLIVISFGFVAYLILLFIILTDLFRDHKISGWMKAVWIIFLFIFPLLTALAYLIVHGGGMAKRQQEAATEAQQQETAYIRKVAGTSPAQQIAEAQALLDKGTITPAEYEQLKAKALAH